MSIPYIITITNVYCKDLTNVEMGSIGWTGIVAGKNDPFVKFKFGSWKDKTQYQDDAGAEAYWDDLKISFKAMSDSILTERLKVQVYDYNNISMHAFIGSCDFDLTHPVERLSEAIELSSDIVDKKNKRSGYISIKIKIIVDEEKLNEMRIAEAKRLKEAEDKRLKEAEEAKAKEAKAKEALEAKRLHDIQLADKKNSKTNANEKSSSNENITNSQNIVSNSPKSKNNKKIKSANIMDRLANCEKDRHTLDVSTLNLSDWPTEAFIFPKLKKIMAFKNKLVSLPSFSTYERLEYLDISRNSINDLSNIQFLILKSLKSLDVSRNSLIELPDDFVSLSKLEFLYIHRNKLVTFPKGMSSLAKLTLINAEYNSLVHIHEDIDQLLLLNELNLSNNPGLDINNLPPNAKRLFEKVSNN